MTIQSKTALRARRILSAYLLLVGLFALSGCSSVNTLRLYYANDGSADRWESTNDQIRISFEKKDFVTLPVRVNGSDTMKFVLDTGAPAIGLFGTDIIDRIGIDTGRPVAVGGSGYGESPTGSLVEGLTISLGDTHLLDQTAVLIPWSEISFLELDEVPDFQGIIGYDLLKRYVVRLDFDESVLTLYQPDSYEYRGNGEVLPLEMHQRKPYTKAAVTLPDGPDVTVKLHVDLGSRGALSLIPGSLLGACRELAPSKQESTTYEPSLVCKLLILGCRLLIPDRLLEITVPADAVRADGFGLSGRVEGYRGLVEELRLGAHTLEGVATKFQTRGHATAGGRQGVLGLRVLERFNVIFDYPRNRMILELRQEPKTVKVGTGPYVPILSIMISATYK